MRYAQIDECECCNGNDIGVSLFTQGCPIKCPGCHNDSIWDFNGGTEFTEETIDTIIELIKKPYIKRLSILGGEPLEPENYYMLKKLLETVIMVKPNIKIWIWTGYTWYNLLLKLKYEFGKRLLWDILKTCNVLIDGPFIQEKKDITLKWRGSSNQNVIDMEQSIFLLHAAMTKNIELASPILYCE